MEFIAKSVPSYRTRLMTLATAARFACCLRANSRFEVTELAESPRAKSEKSWFVTFIPTNPQRIAAMVDRQADRRQQRAETEGKDYLFVLDRNGDRAFHWCMSTSGEVYEVTPHSCSCPDQTYRACPGGCKHMRALVLAVEEGRVQQFQPVPATQATAQAEVNAVFGGRRAA